MTHNIEKDADKKFDTYPLDVRTEMLALRDLVLDVAREDEEIDKVLETLKWGEPSYLVKGGSTLRMDWKEKNPGHLALYFNCQTTLVETFKHLYNGILLFEGNRAVLIDRDSKPNWDALRHCVSLTLNYHKLKHLTLLGT